METKKIFKKDLTADKNFAFANERMPSNSLATIIQGG